MYNFKSIPAFLLLSMLIGCASTPSALRTFHFDGSTEQATKESNAEIMKHLSSRGRGEYLAALARIQIYRPVGESVNGLTYQEIMDLTRALPPAHALELSPKDKIPVRLVKVTGTGNHVPSFIATFEPIAINRPGAGGGSGAGGKSFVTETPMGKQFTVSFVPRYIRDAHQRTLWNVIDSCWSKTEDPSALKFNLVLSIPEKAPKASSTGWSDFSQWVIESIEVPK